MSHFLARLVERTRGTAARVEPLIAPRFAPGGIAELSLETEATITPPQVPAAAERKVKSPLPGELPARQSTTPLVRPSLGKEPEELVSPREAPAAAPFEVLRETLLVPSPETRREPAQREDRIRGSGSLRRDVLPPVQSPGAPPAEIRENPPNGRPRQQRPPTRVPLATNTYNPPNEQSAEPPIVRVTIGRIDVHAAPAPAAPARRPARDTTPKLTLDAYLKSRREGAR